MKKILIAGANGQLGNELKSLASTYSSFEFIYSDLPEVNITDFDSLDAYVNAINPHFIINCAAYTAVDKAESDVELATKVNVLGAKNLALLSKKYHAKFFHVSTDFVFDGRSYTPYTEDSVPNPISVYGDTKLKGEEAVIEANSESIIFRTSWLYSIYGANFVKTMMRLGEERDTLSVIVDQVGTPTWAHDLAEVIMHIISSDNGLLEQQGVFHYSNEGVASWYDFAVEIMDINDLACQVSPILTKEYPTAAARPHFSVMDKSKVKETFGITIPHWKQSLKKCIKSFGES